MESRLFSCDKSNGALLGPEGTGNRNFSGLISQVKPESFTRLGSQSE